MQPEASARADAIIVLGCKVPDAGTRGTMHRRVAAAARLWVEHRPRIVIASGGRPWNGRPEADTLRALLVEQGVPAEAVVRELWSLNTVENAFYSAELLRAAGLSRPAVVTCDWHMKRALVCFAACGVQAMPYPAASERKERFFRQRRRAGELVRTLVDRASFPLWF
jgi:uncharacterized SAM-binding protein YcdF (DUF218 family)